MPLRVGQRVRTHLTIDPKYPNEERLTNRTGRVIYISPANPHSPIEVAFDDPTPGEFGAAWFKESECEVLSDE